MNMKLTMAAASARLAAVLLLSVCVPAGLSAQENSSDQLTAGSASEKRYAVTDFSANFLREEPDFAAELGNQLLMGTPVVITGETSYWRQVQSPDPYKAWCLDMSLVEMDKDQLMAYIAAPKYICTAFYSHVLSAPDEKSDPVSDLVCGDLLLSCDPENSIFSVTDDIPETAREKTIDRRDTSGKGKICDRRDTSGKRIARSWKHRASGEYLDVWLPSGIHGYVKAEDLESFRLWASTRTPDARHILAQAAEFAGVPYQWGGTSSKGVDCSGFTRMVWFMNGILLPRNASQQARCGEEVTVEMRTDSLALCGSLPEKELKEEMIRRTACLESGDLIFFGTPATPGQGQDGKGARISHVGIYIGGGRFIHASRKVRYSSLIPGDPDYYDLSWKMIAARRIIGQEDKGNGVISILSSPAYFIQEF